MMKIITIKSPSIHHVVKQNMSFMNKMIRKMECLVKWDRTSFQEEGVLK